MSFNKSTKEGREAMRLFINSLHREFIAQQKMHSCINCHYFEEDKCSKWDALPPPEIIVYGCIEWEGEIPF